MSQAGDTALHGRALGGPITTAPQSTMQSQGNGMQAAILAALTVHNEVSTKQCSLIARLTEAVETLNKIITAPDETPATEPEQDEDIEQPRGHDAWGGLPEGAKT